MNEPAVRPSTSRTIGNGTALPPNKSGALVERLTDLLQTLTPAILWEADAETFRFAYVSDSAVAILGYPVGLWTRDANFLADHIHPHDLERTLSQCRNSIAKGENHQLVYRMRTAAGSYAWLHDHVFIVRDGEGRIVGLRGLMLDISEQKRVECKLKAQYAVSTALAESETLEDAAPKILRGIGESLGFDVGSLWAPDQAGRRLVLRDIWQADGFDARSFVEASKSRAFEPGIGLPGRVWSTGEPRWIADVETDANFPRAPFAAASGLRSGFAFPIRVGRDVVGGVLEFFATSPAEADPELLEAMDSLGSQIGQFIERKRAEQQLRESQRELADFFDNAVVGLHRVGPDGTILWANQAELDLLGYTSDEYIGHAVNEFHADQDVIDDILRRLKAGEVLHQHEARLRCKDGSIKHVLLDANVRWEHGKFVHTRCFTLDVTQRRHAERALRENERGLRELVEGLGVAMYTTDAEGKITFFNDAAAELWGRLPTLGEDLWCGSWRLYWPDGKPMPHDECPMAITLRENRPVRGAEAVAERPDGTRVAFLPYPTPVRDASGTLIGAVNVLVDITQRTTAERALRESEERLRLAMEAGNMGAWGWNVKTGAVEWSEGLELIHGLRPGTFAGTFEAYLQDVHPDDYELVTKGIQDSLKTSKHDIEYRIVLPNGVTRWVARRGQALQDEHGETIGMIGVCMDITARKRVEERLLLASEAKDEFLGMISHELRTPITTIYGGARLLRTRNGELDDESKLSVAADIEQETERLHRIVEDLLVLSRLELDEHIATEPVLLQRVLTKATAGLRHQNRAIEIDIPNDLAPIAAEQTYLEQVLRNLLSNADKYSPAGLPVLIRAQTNGHGEVVVSVIDNGTGVEPEDVERIFERFYRSARTARSIGGAGIGLTVSKRLIEAQSGRIWARPREEGGLEVSFALPLFKEEMA